MIRHLIRQCPRCKGIIRVQMEGENIIHIENGKMANTYKSMSKYAVKTMKSTKTIQCLNPGIWGQGFKCGRSMWLSKFKEITL